MRKHLGQDDTDGIRDRAAMVKLLAFELSANNSRKHNLLHRGSGEREVEDRWEEKVDDGLLGTEM